MEILLTNPRALEDFLNRKIGPLERLVEQVMDRNAPQKRPQGRVEGREAVAALGG